MIVKIKTRSVYNVQPGRDASGANLKVNADMSLLDMKETIMEILKVVPGQTWDLWQQDFDKE